MRGTQVFYLIKKDTFFYAVKHYMARSPGLNNYSLDESAIWSTHDKDKALKFESLAIASKYHLPGFVIAELDNDNVLKIVKG